MSDVDEKVFGGPELPLWPPIAARSSWQSNAVTKWRSDTWVHIDEEQKCSNFQLDNVRAHNAKLREHVPCYQSAIAAAVAIVRWMLFVLDVKSTRPGSRKRLKLSCKCQMKMKLLLTLGRVWRES